MLRARTPALSLLFALAVPALLAQPSARLPIIKHTPPTTAERAKPMALVAQVDGNGSEVKAVYLYYTTSRDSAPTRSTMKATGVGAYYGSIPSTVLKNAQQVFYYMEAGNTAGEWAETGWSVVGLGQAVPVIPGPTPVPVPQPESVSQRPAWFWPAVIGGGALIIAGGAAIASSGGGGGGGGGDPAPAPSGGGDSTPNTFTQGANDFVSSTSLVTPRSTPIDASASLAGRTVTQVLVNLNFNPVDGAEGGTEQYEIIYNGQTVFTSPVISAQFNFSQTFPGDSSLVIIRVTDSQQGADGRFFYSWNATATFTTAP